MRRPLATRVTRATRATLATLATLACVAATLPGCGGKAGPTPDPCPEGHEAQGPACVPRFDPCPGSAEVPILGGGCLPVGVITCAEGFLSDSEGGCEPVLPPGPDPCPPGTMEVLGEISCQPVGVASCAEGFLSDGEGGCEPVLPPGPDPCPPGTMEVLGHATCQPLGDCGPDPDGWGLIPVDPDTLFVDASADATGADGSQARPFPTLEAAYAVAPAGAQLAVASGEYTERLVIDRPLRLTGRCAERVVIRGRGVAGQDRPPVHITAGGSGTALRGLTLTGDGVGLQMESAIDVSVSQCQILHAGDAGIDARRSALSLEDVVVAKNSGFGLFLVGTEASITRAVIRDHLSGANARYGRGINAQCYPGEERCGHLHMSASLVLGNAEVGVFLVGPDAEITGSVIADTLPGASGHFGRGLSSQCDAAEGICGSFALDGSLVAGNAELGLYLSGAQASITNTVIRDTTADARGAGGWGIEATCPTGDLGCGQVEVTGSVITGNREVGILVTDVDTAIRGSIVSHTLEGTSEEGGCGIGAQCGGAEMGCGRLTVEGSLVTGNSGIGVFLAGVEAVITGSVVAHTLWGESGTRAWGIGAQCVASPLGCTRLDLHRSVVTGNAEIGVYLPGADTRILGSVIRRTATGSDGQRGRGIHAQCDPRGLGCGTLEMTGSHVSGSADIGVGIMGPEATLTHTVIRDSVPDERGGHGRGVEALCPPGDGVCGPIRISHCLVAGHAEVGILLGVLDASITASVIRDTLPDPDGDFGRGVNAQCPPGRSLCGTLDITDTLVAKNTEVGIFLAGVEAQLSGCVIRHTSPGLTQEFGRGLVAQCDPAGRGCGRLDVTTSLVANNHDVGVYLAGVPTTLWSVMVIDTHQNTGGPYAEDMGHGVFATCDEGTLSCATLTMTSSLAEGSFSAGVASRGVSGAILGSVIRDVAPRALDGRYGYGVQISGAPEGSATLFHVQRSQITSATLAGILYVGAGGTVSGSEVSGADFSVVMNVGSRVTLTSDNRLSGDIKNEASWQSLEPSPAPPPALPMLNSW